MMITARNDNMRLEEVSKYKGKHVMFNGGTYLLIGLKHYPDGRYTAKLLDVRTKNCIVWAKLDTVTGAEQE